MTVHMTGILQLKEAIRFFSVVDNKHKHYVINRICLEDKDHVPNSATFSTVQTKKKL